LSFDCDVPCGAAPEGQHSDQSVLTEEPIPGRGH
jgi:hypothetical protein